MCGLKVVTVGAEEIVDEGENPTLCMSPTRYFDECHKCPVFQRYWMRGEEGKMPCKPHLKPWAFTLLRRKRKLLGELAEIDRQLEAAE